MVVFRGGAIRVVFRGGAVAGVLSDSFFDVKRPALSSPSPLSPSSLSLSDDVDAGDMRAEFRYTGKALLSVGRYSSARKAFVVNQISFKILYAPSLSPFSFS